MPRKKNYEAPQPRAEQARPIQKITGGGVPAPDADGACIDMVSLLGPGARFGSSARNIDLSDWLGRGIDAWVWASVVCLKAMLRSGARETATVTGYSSKLKIFFRVPHGWRAQDQGCPAGYARRSRRFKSRPLSAGCKSAGRHLVGP